MAPWSRSERELVRAAQRGDVGAREQLVTSFLPAISGVARRYQRANGVERAELTQEGVVGLLRALERYEPTRPTPFWGYASFWVRQAMQQLVAEVSRPVALSDRALRGLAAIRRTRSELRQRRAREPSITDLALATGYPREQVERLLSLERVPRGVEERLRTDDTGTVTLGEMLADPIAEDAYEQVIRQTQTEQVLPLANLLGERERNVLYEHYGLGRPAHTLHEIGGRLGVTAERVRQIEEGALQKLRDAAEGASPLPLAARRAGLASRRARVVGPGSPASG